ncbi:MAG: transcription antitermination factor NusB [Bacillota bacterium]
MEKTKLNRANRTQQRGLIIEELYRMDIHGENTFEDTPYTFVNSTIEAVNELMADIDKLISDNLKGWTIRRLSFVDRAILRLAVYEMAFTETGREVAIDEALKLTKKYSDEGDRKHVSFNNRVLDTVKKQLEEA